MSSRDVASPVALGALVLRHRLAAAPMATNLAAPDGTATPELLAHYRALAASGVALVTVESAAVSPEAVAAPRNLGVFDAGCGPGLQALARVLREAGALSCLQLWHAGSRALRPPWAGRNVADLGAADLRAVQAQFAAAARRALAAGFDAVEVHAAHGYLLHELYCPCASPTSQQEPAAAGAKTEKLLAVVAAVSAEAGADRPVIVRLSATCGRQGVVTEATVGALVRDLAGLGCAAISVSAGHNSTALVATPPAATAPGYLLPYAARVKRQTRLPVLAAGRLHDRGTIDQALAGGAADVILAGRALLADPQWASKILAGTIVRTCCYCNRCYEGLKAGLPLQCRGAGSEGYA